MAEKTFGVRWGDEAPKDGGDAEQATLTAVREPAKKKPAAKKPAAKKPVPRRAPAKKVATEAAPPVKVAAQPAESQLAALAADPLVFVKLAPRPPKGAGQEALNVNIPADDLAWLRSFTDNTGLTQKDLMRAFIQALRADVEADTAD